MIDKVRNLAFSAGSAAAVSILVSCSVEIGSLAKRDLRTTTVAAATVRTPDTVGNKADDLQPSSQPTPQSSVSASPSPTPNGTANAACSFQGESAASDALSIPSGAIRLYYNDTVQGPINPYFSSYHLLFRLEADPSPNVLNLTKKYLLWYLDHINVASSDGKFRIANGFEVAAPYLSADEHRPGTIYNYYFSSTDPDLPTFMYFKKYPQAGFTYTDFRELDKNSALFSTLVYDSSDSYGAMFIKLLAKYTSVSNDYSIVNDPNLFYRVQLVLQGMLSTQTAPYNLTGATIHFLVGYYMDNAEVWSALSDYVNLMGAITASKIGSFDIAGNISTYTALRNQFAAAIESNLRITTGGDAGLYRVGIDLNSGAQQNINWTNPYPDANANLLGIMVGHLVGTIPTQLATDRFYAYQPRFIDGKNLGNELPNLWMATAFVKTARTKWSPHISNLLNVVCTNNIVSQNRSWNVWNAFEGGAYLWLLQNH